MENGGKEAEMEWPDTHEKPDSVISSQGNVVLSEQERVGHPNAHEGPGRQGLKNAIKSQFIDTIRDLSEA